jgi:glycosyltransferase involved in cell wall biosynthesis
MIRPLLKNVDIVITATPEFASTLSNVFKIKSIVIPDIVGDKWFQGEKRRFKDPILTDVNVRLLHVGPFENKGRKRTDEIMKVFSEAVEVYPKLRLTTIGGSENQLNNAKNYAKELGIFEKVIIQTGLSEEELLEAYSNSDIYVTMTTYEGFYRPIIEAFMTGMPAIVYDARLITSEKGIIAQVNHVLKSGGGLLFDGTTDSFLEALRKIIREYSYFRKRAIEYSNQFKSEGIIDKYVNLIDELTNIH